MTLNGHIISTRGKRLHTIEIQMTGTGLTRLVIYAAEQAAKTWARAIKWADMADQQATTWAELKPYADQIARGDLQAVPV